MIIGETRSPIMYLVLGSKAVDRSNRDVCVEIMRVMKTYLPIRSLDHQG
jgi:hypothetical protein